jgi:membrane protease YdiL (CAAX protease family)
MFRGFLRTAVQQVASVVGNGLVADGVAIAGPALLFGIAHRSQGRTGVITAATVGICFDAWFALNGQNLLPLIVARGTINSISHVFMFFSPERFTGDG